MAMNVRDAKTLNQEVTALVVGDILGTIIKLLEDEQNSHLLQLEFISDLQEGLNNAQKKLIVQGKNIDSLLSTVERLENQIIVLSEAHYDSLPDKAEGIFYFTFEED